MTFIVLMQGYFSLRSHILSFCVNQLIRLWVESLNGISTVVNIVKIHWSSTVVKSTVVKSTFVNTFKSTVVNCT